MYTAGVSGKVYSFLCVFCEALHCLKLFGEAGLKKNACSLYDKWDACFFFVVVEHLHTHHLDFLCGGTDLQLDCHSTLALCGSVDKTYGSTSLE